MLFIGVVLQFSVRASNINFQSTSSSVPLEISKDTGKSRIKVIKIL